MIKRRKTTDTKAKVPAIVVTVELAQQDTGQFIQRIRSIAQDKDCKIRYSDDTHKIFCSNLDCYRTLKEGVVVVQQEFANRGKALEFHTHQIPREKLQHIVAKGLPVLSTEEI
ncbi:hypothetical protein QAD02_009124 [Eretmocerus hayati]|uniref:Uncharacterized protein n=1 Tax=Eretmocerus hayati TaxID=131215 RepID=A0ACC2N8S7_9HYME|nr:hypothetical protein QAD02_009124 [Eretmocerus hayati]